MRVENMASSRGNLVPNQFIIETDKGTYFQSYNTVIAFKSYEGKIQLDMNSWDCSVTTTRYRNQFLGENTKETRKHIKDGDYELVDLNT